MNATRTSPARGARALRALLLLAGLLAARLPLSAQDEVGHPDDPETCLRCHEPVKQHRDLEFPHSPVSEGTCNLCHASHASRFEHLLKKRERTLCFSCHEQARLTFTSGVVHRPIQEGKCSVCHEPHGSANKSLVRTAGNDLCLGCHEEKKKALDKPTVHLPFSDGACTDCHDPHHSENDALLKASANKLCARCHKQDEKLAKAHFGVPLERADCVGCHEPHASDLPKLARQVGHKPFLEGRCDECHVAPGSKAAGAMVATGGKLCTKCHDAVPRPGDSKVHKPVADGDCTRCHTPHAADRKGLLKKENTKLCEGCHEPVKTKFETSRTSHPLPADKGGCSICHQPHSSKDGALLQSDAIRTCLGCHPTQRHGHPVGGDIQDPRTKQPLTCVSCHDPHGTAFPMFLRGDQTQGLCTECHSDSGKHDDERRRRKGH